MVFVDEKVETVIEETETTNFTAIEDLTTGFIWRNFHLKKVKDTPALIEWLEMDFTVSHETKKRLNILRNRLDIDGLFYNKGELQWHFLSPLMDLVDFRSEPYRNFSGRIIQAEVYGISLKGSIGFLLAYSDFEPDPPFFFLHNYKEELGKESDPLGQLLGGMLIAQQQNEDKNPIYGCYSIGRLWHFVVLDGKKYSVTSGHIASNDDIYEIYGMLVKMKTIIREKWKL